jgi:hypothetical protein
LLRERLMEILGTDLVDLVDLSNASALLRNPAQDGLTATVH